MGSTTAELEASRLPRHLGFLLHDAFPHSTGQAVLSVQLREQPTLAHFDPELITFWRTGSDLRGHADELTLASPMPVTCEYSWGRIVLIDRLGIVNEFVSMGGVVSADRVEGGATVRFASPVPILRLGGHSLAVDQIALDIGAFFGRIMVPIDFRSGAEGEVASAPPEARWAAFVEYQHRRYLAHVELRAEHSEEAAILYQLHEALRRTRPDWLAEGRHLLASIGLAT